ncbi:MAG: hypothetical protein RSE41_02430, partial [Clostridia bacterium]
MAQINMEMSEYQELIDTISKLKSENSQLKLDNKSTEDFYRQSIAEEKTKTAEALEGKQISYYTADLNAYRNEINSQMTALYSYIVQKNTNISTYRSKFVEYNIKQIITEITEQISTIRDSVKNKNITLNRKIIGLDEAINVAKNEIYLDYKDSLEKKLVYLNDTIEENKKIREKLESEKNEYK